MRLIDTTDERLYQMCKEVANPKSLSIKMLKDKMIKIMIREDGIGLATTQVGRNEALFVMYNKNKIITCINPSIEWQSDEKVILKEGCLSFPNMYISLNRSKKIIAKYTNLKGEVLTELMEGIEAICFQHELDHLSGITFIHRQNEQVS